MKAFAKIILLILTYCISLVISNRSFVVDYENDRFLKDGQPFRYISGSFHYFRTPRGLWRDRMEKSRAMGANAIQTYIQWSAHETYQNVYNFDKDCNITEFFEIAQNLSLLVILRIGPYIDNAVDFGGFPYWLLKYANIRLRTGKDERYTAAVAKWFSVLLPIIRPMLYVNGGPVIMVQAENEYGSYGCDKAYTSWLQNLTMQYLRDQVVYFTTDGAGDGMVRCGQVQNTLTTVDFGISDEHGVVDAFNILRKYMPKGPKVNSEFYPGWFDVWGQANRSVQASKPVTDTMMYMWRQNASFNIFPIHGGTSWGYQGGSFYPPFRPVTTEFDNDAPISESGDVMQKFFDMKSAIEEFTGETVKYPVPKNSTKFHTGNVLLQYLGNVFDLLYTLASPDTVKLSVYPLTMEDLDTPYGFVLYECKISKTGQNITIGEIRDRAYIMIDYQLVKVVQRDSVNTRIHLTRTVDPGSMLHILVENQGRICYGGFMNDNKGLVSNVTLDNVVITNWTMYPLKLENLYSSDKKVSLKKYLKKHQSRVKDNRKHLPSVYLGYIMPETIGDTYFNSTGWGKGQLFVNGYNIGRYWPTAGPQIGLYVPSTYLDIFNQVIIFELDQPGNCEDKFKCYISFVEQPIYT